jgi:hypothetical protein
MILLIQQIIKISIDYSKFETVIKIDIEQETEQSIIPAFQIGLPLIIANKVQLKGLFGEKFSITQDDELLISEIFNRNHTRKSLFIGFQHKELSQFLGLKVGNRILNISLFTKSFDSFSIPLNIMSRKSIFPTIWSVFNLDIDANELESKKNNREIFKILFDFERYKKFKKNFLGNNLIFRIDSNNIQSIRDKDIFISDEYSLFMPLRGTKHLNIEYGKEICSHYKSNDRPFDAISKNFCLRKCYKNYCQNRLKCSPLVINEIISSIDEEKNELKFCSRKENDLCNEWIDENNKAMNQCLKYCPKDCFEFDVQTIDVDILLNKEYSTDLTEVQLFWDKNYPLVSYIETPVMTFTDYICYCGGLFGLWFGINANQVLIFIVNSENWMFFKDKLKLLIL